jgi:deazaflavin-dependent oxidoreductase (nitroreductase family)
MPVLLLTTVGRSSGRRRTRPVGYVRDGDALLVVASNGALTSHPSWYFNLRANPAAQVELGGERMNVTATILQSDERERAWRVVTMKYPFFHVYERSVRRVIPVLRLRVNEGRSSNSRLEHARR